jgi:phage tail protein X
MPGGGVLVKTYATVQGDMWDSIAHVQLGDVLYTDKLMNMNRQHLGYYIFPAGVALALPEIDTEISDAAPPWKQVDDEQ